MLTMNRLKKAGAVFVILLINLMVSGIIALNVFVIWKDFPQWIMILAAMLDIAVVLLIAKKVFAGKVAKIIAVSITSVFAVLCVLFAYACPYWNSDGYKLSEGPVLYYENSDLTGWYEFTIGINGFTPTHLDSVISFIEVGDNHPDSEVAYTIDLTEEEQKAVYDCLNEQCRKYLGKGCEDLLGEARMRMGVNST